MAVIDVGAAVIGRASDTGGAYTYIDLDNPANDTGIINSIEVWFATTGTNVKIGTFYGSGLNWTVRDYVTVASIPSGSKQTITSISIDVQTGDCIGFYSPSGNIEYDTSGGTGMLYVAGDKFGGGSNAYTALAGDLCSLYGTGTTDIGWANITHLNGLVSATISHVNGVAVAAISHVNGIAV